MYDITTANGIIESQNREIAELKAMVRNLQPNHANMRPIYNTDGLLVGHAIPTLNTEANIISFTAKVA